MKRIASIVLSVVVAVASAFGAGTTPISELKLTSNADGGTNSFTNLNVVVAATVNVTSNLIVQGSNVTAKVFDSVSVTALGSTILGSEGFRLVGALGGYTLEEFMEDTALRGPARDMPVFSHSNAPISDLTVSWTSGDVYSPADGYYRVTAGTNTLTDNSVNYAYWSMTSKNVLQWTTTRPNVDSNIVFATFVSAFGMVIGYDAPEASGDFPLNTRAGAANIAPSLIVTGVDYFPIDTNLNAIGMNGGIEYHDMRSRKEHNFQDLRNPAQTHGMLTYAHTNVGLWGYTMTNQFPVGRWDNGTNVVACVATNWYRGTFLSLPDSPFMHYIYPQISYTSSVDAIEGFDPSLPPGFYPYVPLCTAYIFQGDDAGLRTDAQYWVDRRFQIRRPGTTTVTSGGSAPTPSLNQVLIAGSSLGGILPYDAGFPTDTDQLSSKGYVDSTINNINARRAYVDTKGNDVTAELESSIKPFRNIQTAIDAAAAVAGDTNRYVISLSPGDYTENISMSNYIAVAGIDMESTKIIGTVTYPHGYTDISGGEISLVTVTSSNSPALIIDAGGDNAYIGARSCYLISLWDNDAAYKSVVDMRRGLAELYATTYCELNIAPTNGSSTVNEAQIFEHTTDLANNGLSTFTAFGMSSLITCSDTNDNVNYMYTHDNLDSRCINTSIGSAMNVHLDDSTNHANNVRIVSHNTAIGRTLSMGTILRAYVNATNNCNFNFGWAENGTGENVAIVRGNHFRIIGAGSSNVWLGAAITTNDGLRVYDSVYINNLADYPYPRIYTNNGSAGKFFINTVTESGAHLFGGAIDMSALSTPTITTPERGHMKQYAGVYAGLENPYYKDSSGNTMRGLRDNFYNGYNDDTTTMAVGSAVYISTGLSSDNTPKVKKCIASDPSTMPCIGIVVQVGGIATGRVGRVMIMGRMEAGMDTSAFTSGQKLYVSSTVAGGIINIAPTGTNIAQLIGTCHIVSPTTGYVNVRVWNPDTIGTMTPSTIDAATLNGYSGTQWLANSNEWNTSYTWVFNNSNGVAYVFSRTNTWDAISATVLARSNYWDSAYSWVLVNSSGVASALGRTGVWNTASVDATFSTNWIKLNSNGVAYALGRTNAWDTAATNASNILNIVTNSWGFNEPVPTTTKPNDIYLSSEFHKARSWVEFHAMTEAGTVLGQIVVRDNRNPIRTYTVVTNFSATTTSTNPIALAGTIPSLSSIGVVVTNVAATTTNLWMSLDYATTNGMKDL